MRMRQTLELVTHAHLTGTLRAVHVRSYVRHIHVCVLYEPPHKDRLPPNNEVLLVPFVRRRMACECLLFALDADDDHSMSVAVHINACVVFEISMRLDGLSTRELTLVCESLQWEI